MNSKDITGLRLINQHLAGNKFTKPEEVVGWFGAIQSQDFNAAKWTLGLRLKNPSDALIEDAYNRGLILRTHVMRPTWHFVLAEDLFWMQKLTSENVKKLMTHYNRKLEITEELFKKTEKLIINALRDNNYLTRQEIKGLLKEKEIETDVQRLAHIVSWAELNAVICSGPMKGKQFTYALAEERIKKSLKLSKEESLAKLALKYFQSHGPSLLKDFSWWSGLSIKDSGEAISTVKSKLLHETVDKKEYFFLRNLPATYNIPHETLLLSVYDEYFIGYKDRSLLLDEKYSKNMAAVGNALLTSLLVINGKVTGTWKRKLKKVIVDVEIKPFTKLNKKEKYEIKGSALKYSKFLDKKISLKYFEI